MIKLFGLVMVVLMVLGFGVGAQGFSGGSITPEYKTFYSPEKKFSIEYMPSKSFPLNITETQNQVVIKTGPLVITVVIMDTDPILPAYLIQQSSYLETNIATEGKNTITETTHPITINGEKAYSFTDMYQVEDFDGTIIHDHIFMRHDGKDYTINLQYDISHAVMAQDEIMHTKNSIKFS